MSEHRERVLEEVARLPDPVLPAAREQHIRQLARARFVASTTHTRGRRAALARAPELVAAALLCASGAAYLIWTATTVASLQPSQHGILWQRAASGSSR